MADEVKQITIEDILSEYHREIVSPPAVKLYAAVWFRMGNRGRFLNPVFRSTAPQTPSSARGFRKRFFSQCLAPNRNFRVRNN
jgi:hypothetical protein